MTLRKTSLFISLTGIVGMLVGCADSGDSSKEPSNDKPKTTVFESDAPGTSSKSRGAYGPTLAMDNSAESSNGAGGSAAAGTTASKAADTGAADSAARAIEEADIIKVENNRLYALSQYGGLNIIDVSERDNMRLLGREKVMATPFEMYVRDSIVFALYNGYGEYIEGETEGEWTYVQTSHVIAFDTTDAASPRIVGKFEVPGTISDSRIVGNILYVVGFESNSCWRCQEGQHTTVISLNISDPAGITKVDQLTYSDDTSTQYSWQRSISVTDKRMYIAGPEYGTNGPVGSSIQVVDISNPTGDLVEGAKVKAAGSVMSRWQMDEYDGHLRVISQPGQWSFTEDPSIQTYKVESASSVTALANVAMTIPDRESLRSVRFDGTRGYAITAEQKDPLFTIDLSDPAAPKQVGELTMDGWVYHMEPRGERVVALGYDQGNPDGALAISLFDVSNLAQPKMLDRVNFGGDWSWISEDQDRIHKAFQVLDTANLVLMPFSGWDYSEDNCSGRSRNGIQLVDYTNDDLTLRGVASMVGQPRRGFLHDERLFAMSDDRVETFDIADRSAPKRKDSLQLVHNVQSTVVAGDTIVKFAQDWYTNTIGLDTTTLSNVESPAAMGHLDLSIGSDRCNNNSWLGTVATSGSRVYLVINENHYDTTTGNSTQSARLLTVDVSSAKSPKVIGEATLDFGEGWSYWNNGNLVTAGAQSVAVGNAFAILSTKTDYTYNPEYSYSTQSVLHILDVTDPNKPQKNSISVPGEFGTTGLFADGNTIALGRYETSAISPERVRFFVDRVNVSNPASPEKLAPVNVPGSIVAFNEEASNVVTVDYEAIEKTNVTSKDCYASYSNAWFELADTNGVYDENAIGTCHSQQQSLFLVKLGTKTASVLGSMSLDVGETVGNIATGKDRVFMTLGQSYSYGRGMVADVGVSCKGCGYSYGWSAFEEKDVPLVVLGGLSSNNFATGTIELAGGNNYWGSTPMVAANDRVLMSTGWQGKLAVIESSDATKPTLVREATVIGGVSQLSVADGVGIASLGYDGVQTIRMTK